MRTENRKNQRIPADIWTYLTKTSDGGRHFDIRITNLSAGGAAFTSREKFALGEKVSFLVQAGILIGVKARVVSSVRVGKIFRHGMDFIEIDPSHYQVLSNYIRRQLHIRGLKPLELDLV